MKRKSAKVKLDEYLSRKAQEARERERNEDNSQYHPQREGFVPDRA